MTTAAANAEAVKTSTAIPNDLDIKTSTHLDLLETARLIAIPKLLVLVALLPEETLTATGETTVEMGLTSDEREAVVRIASEMVGRGKATQGEKGYKIGSGHFIGGER